MTRVAKAGLLVVGVAVAVSVVVGERLDAETAVSGATSRVATTAPAQTAATAEPVVVNLLEEAVFKRFWIDPVSQYTIKDGVLKVHNPSGKGPGFRGLVGGASWDNYRVSLEFRVTEVGDAGWDKWQGGFPANVQISPNFGSIFCQVFRDGACNLAYYDTEFHHVQTGSASVKRSDWNTVSVEVQDGFASVVVNRQAARSGEVPIGTRGALGLLVNFSSDATVEIRNVELELLRPTEAQLQELQTKAAPGKTVE